MGGNQAMIAAGIGFRSSASAAEMAALVTRAMVEARVAVTTLAVPDRKANAATQDAATILGLPLMRISDAALAAAQPLCVTHSTLAAAATGHASIAEGCAVAAAGPGGRLILPRIAGSSVTCALAAGDGA